jgi:hypothetical protein
VKQSNWGAAFKYRFPQTRMGVPAFHPNRFTAAQQYAAAIEKQRREGGPPVRRDLELEAIAEIIRGERLIHCHSYRQDEIVAFLRVMEKLRRPRGDAATRPRRLQSRRRNREARRRRVGVCGLVGLQVRGL